jgi:hypothetical protein
MPAANRKAYAAAHYGAGTRLPFKGYQRWPTNRVNEEAGYFDAAPFATVFRHHVCVRWVSFLCGEEEQHGHADE